MRLVFLFLVNLLLISCTAGKIHFQNTCSVKQVSGGYTKISDSEFVYETKKLGRTYLNLIIDSCKLISNGEINLTGHVTFAEGNLNGGERKMPDVDIIQAIQADNDILKYTQYLGKTDQSGKFDITVSTFKKRVFILLDKQNFNYTSVLLSY
jgi:hypothetical protein